MDEMLVAGGGGCGCCCGGGALLAPAFSPLTGALLLCGRCRLPRRRLLGARKASLLAAVAM
jgi:hypothetical protein